MHRESQRFWTQICEGKSWHWFDCNSSFHCVLGTACPGIRSKVGAWSTSTWWSSFHGRLDVDSRPTRSSSRNLSEDRHKAGSSTLRLSLRLVPLLVGFCIFWGSTTARQGTASWKFFRADWSEKTSIVLSYAHTPCSGEIYVQQVVLSGESHQAVFGPGPTGPCFISKVSFNF